jgi:hypothetical protein
MSFLDSDSFVHGLIRTWVYSDSFSHGFNDRNIGFGFIGKWAHELLCPTRYSLVFFQADLTPSMFNNSKTFKVLRYAGIGFALDALPFVVDIMCNKL